MMPRDTERPRTESDPSTEEEVDDSLSVLIKKKTLYHGSGVSGIEELSEAEEDTVGRGIYFTSEHEDAIGYARRRSRTRKDAEPVVYETSIENMRLLDLRKDENVRRVLDGFKEILQDKLKKSELSWNQEEILKRAIKAIEAGKVKAGNLKEVTFSLGRTFSDHVKSLGYEGLVTLEGGEGEDIGDHDTYLIFDSEKIKINQEHKIL